MASSKTILIMRHAKSSWDDSSLRDFERPLNKRGNRDAPAMGHYLKKLGMIPDYIISSPAIRARQTVLHLSGVFDINEDKLNWNEDLYFKGAEAYLKSIRTAPDTIDSILIAGHNPSVEQVVANLTGDTSIEITTANIIFFESDATNWAGVEMENCRFKWLVRPKDIE